MAKATPQRALCHHPQKTNRPRPPQPTRSQCQKARFARKRCHCAALPLQRKLVPAQQRRGKRLGRTQIFMGHLSLGMERGATKKLIQIPRQRPPLLLPKLRNMAIILMPKPNLHLRIACLKRLYLLRRKMKMQKMHR